MNAADERQLLEERKLVAAVNRELYRIERITKERERFDIESAESYAHFRNDCKDKRPARLKAQLIESGEWIECDSIHPWIDAAGRYIKLEPTKAYDGRLTISNVELLIEGTYHRLALSYTGPDEFARRDHGEEEERGPFCGAFGLGSMLTAQRMAKAPEVVVTDGDVIEIACIDFRVRTFRGQYIALDRIEKDGSLKPGEV